MSLTVPLHPVEKETAKRRSPNAIHGYTGETKNGKRHGMGTMVTDKGVYVGQWKDDTMNGKGIYKWSNGQVYEGEYKNDKRHGKGTYTWPDGHRYIGDFKEGKRSGMGVYEWPNGDIFQGQWKDGSKHGFGKKIYADGSLYEGEWADDEKHGKGLFTKNGQQTLQEFKKGMLIVETPLTPNDVCTEQFEYKIAERKRKQHTMEPQEKDSMDIEFSKLSIENREKKYKEKIDVLTNEVKQLRKCMGENLAQISDQELTKIYQHQKVVLQKLEQEVNRRREAKHMCVICMDNEKCMAAFPCGHVIMCEPCFQHTKSNTSICPLCRGTVQEMRRVLL